MKTSLALLSLAIATNTWAQFGGPPRQDTGERQARLFGKHNAFTATAHVVTTDTRGKQKDANEMSYAFLDGKLRTEIITGKSSELDEMGLGKMVILARPDKQTAYMIYPGLKAYCEVPPSAKQTAGKESKMDTTDLGEEKIDKHPCTKQKVVVTDANGEQDEMLQWVAHDMKDFPVQTQVRNGKDTVTTTFRDVKFAKPDAALFELPADFKRYGSMQELMMGAMQQMMGGQ